MGDARSEWDRVSGLSEEQREATNYVMEMATHQLSQAGLLGSIIAGAVLSFPLGIGVAAIPVLGFFGAGAIAALFVPSSPVFRHRVDRRKRSAHRAEVRNQLLEKITDASATLTDRRTEQLARYGLDHQRMRDRLKSLEAIARSRKSELSDLDVDRLDEATVDYLRLVYSRIVLWGRMDGARTKQVKRQLQEIDEQLENSTHSADRKNLEKAKGDLERIMQRRARLPAQDASSAAQLTAMAETFEDLYHRIQTNPNAGVSDYLNEATERLSIEEELGYAVQDEIADLTNRRRRSQGASA